MLGRLVIAAAFLFVAFLFFGGWWLMGRKKKDKQEQEEIDELIENIPQVEIPPLVLDRLKERILHDIEIYRRGGGTEEEVEILQMPQPLKEIEPCSGCRLNLTTITKGGG